MSAIFVTATGTDVGKTFVTAGLLRELGRSGRNATALKPVMSGFDDLEPESSDAGILLAAMGRSPTRSAIATIAPWRFRAPLSPDMAARREGTAVDFGKLVAFSRDAVATRSDVVLVEGVGGIMTPLTDGHTVLDLMVALELPVILVAGSYLGTISHSLSAFDVLRRRGLDVLALVVSETAGAIVGLDETVSSIARFASTEVMGLPRLSGDSAGHPVFARLAEILSEPA